MSEKGIGQDDQEYRDCTCFWGAEPGKYVRLLHKQLPTGRVLGLGTGEGKNAIYLAHVGLEVVAVECSHFAISNFRNRLCSIASVVSSRIEIVQADVLTYRPTSTFDGVIAYGLLHCLPSLDSVRRVVALMKSATVRGALNVAVTFTDIIPVPPVQSYLEATLLVESELPRLYSDWELLKYETDIIEEVHPTSRIKHAHGICRLLARRDVR